MFKRVVSLFILCCLIIGTVGLSTNAEEKEEIAQIKSLEEAYQNAVNGESDLSKEELEQFRNFMPEVGIQALGTAENDDINIDEYITAQVISDDGENKEIVVTTFDDVSIMADYTKNGSNTDSTLSVRATVRAQFQTSTKNGMPYVKLTGTVSGGWTILDSQVSLSNRSVRYGTSGATANNSTTKYPTSNSFSYSVPTSWAAVPTETINFVGATSNVTIKRGGSSWGLPLSVMW